MGLEPPKVYHTLFLVSRTVEEAGRILSHYLKPSSRLKMSYDFIKLSCDGRDLQYPFRTCDGYFESVDLVSSVMSLEDQIFHYAQSETMYVDVIPLSDDLMFVRRIYDRYTFKRTRIRGLRVEDILTD